MSNRPKVYIMSGISGAGKTTEAERIAKHYGTSPITVSADRYFVKNDGKYKFNAAELPQAHAYCLLKFTEVIYGSYSGQWLGYTAAVIVDNTNLTTVEMAPYVALAMACGCEVEIVTVHCDPKVAAERNIHNVSASTIERMDKALRFRELPPFWRVTQRTIDTNPANMVVEQKPRRYSRTPF